MLMNVCPDVLIFESDVGRMLNFQKFTVTAADQQC